MKELTDEQLLRQDYVDNEIYRLIQDLNPTMDPIEWNIEIIGEIRDTIQDCIVERLGISSEQDFYPFIKN